MNGHEIEVSSGDHAVKIVRALGGHRYVLGRHHEVHAIAVDAARDSLKAVPDLVLWADSTLADSSIDISSHDERLYKRVNDAELATLLSAFWSKDSGFAKVRLEDRLETMDVVAFEPFAEDGEDEIFPLLVDAGWELLPLATLDEERHKGVIDSFGERIAFESARFVEEDSVPPRAYLIELPAMGAAELLLAYDEESPLDHLLVWTDGPEPYIDYLLRGIARAASK